MFRKETTIELNESGQTRQVAVYEMTPVQIHACLPFFGRLMRMDAESDFFSVLGEHWEAIMRVLESSTDLGEELRELGGAALAEVLEAFVTVNQDFFSRLTGLLQAAPTAPGPNNAKPKRRK